MYFNLTQLTVPFNGINLQPTTSNVFTHAYKNTHIIFQYISIKVTLIYSIHLEFTISTHVGIYYTKHIFLFERD